MQVVYKRGSGERSRIGQIERLNCHELPRQDPTGCYGSSGAGKALPCFLRQRSRATLLLHEVIGCRLPSVSRLKPRQSSFLLLRAVPGAVLSCEQVADKMASSCEKEGLLPEPGEFSTYFQELSFIFDID